MRRAATFLVLLTGLAGPCRRPAGESPAPVWHHDLASAEAEASAQGKPAVVFFSASWNAAAQEMRRTVLVDPEVRAVLAERFVAVEIDCSDTDAPAVVAALDRFHLTSAPALVVAASDLATEIRSFGGFVPASELAAALRSVPARR